MGAPRRFVLLEQDCFDQLILNLTYFGRVNNATIFVLRPTVPEPSTVGLLLVGAGLVAFRRMRRS
jgi:hypothetical protein